MMRTIVVLTGAGISAESGIQTFRGTDGLWEGHRVEDVATPDAFVRDPGLVHAFYNQRRRQLLDGIEPNAAHRALADLDEGFDGNVVVVTQNIDDLHERGGSHWILHMHGELLQSRCTACGRISDVRGDMSVDSVCDECGRRGALRPNIVWFGEVPHHMPEIERHMGLAELFLSVGTSGRVYPAAGFAELARHHGARTIEVNLEKTGGSGNFHESLIGLAGEVLPDLVERILSR